jgi:serine/threonine protein phosphatase PrpC
VGSALEYFFLSLFSLSFFFHRKKKQYDENFQFAVEVAEDQGPRPYMEDRQVSIPFANELIGVEDKQISLFGVFDGHGGSDTAEYVATHLPINFLRAYQDSNAKDVRASKKRPKSPLFLHL